MTERNGANGDQFASEGSASAPPGFARLAAGVTESAVERVKAGASTIVRRAKDVGAAAQAHQRTDERTAHVPGHHYGDVPSITVCFVDESEYVTFTDYVYERFGGRGLGFTDVPIARTVRLTQWLFDQTHDHFAMHRVTEADRENVRARSEGREPFDVRTVDAFFGVGEDDVKTSE